MARHEIPLETYPRREHFRYFRTMAQPYVGLTVPVDITAFLACQRERQLPFFLSLLYCVSRAANAVPELRQRIDEDGKIYEYDWCPSSHTEGLGDGTYCYCALRSDMPLAGFLPYAQEACARARARGDLMEDEEAALSCLYISSLPWLSYEAIIQPTPIPADTHPRINWGKWRQEGDRVVLPVSLLCNHALADGLHIARFYAALEEELAHFVRTVQAPDFPPPAPR